MEYFKEVNFKRDISFFYDLEKHIKHDTTFSLDKNVFMCWTQDNIVFDKINNFVAHIATLLNCRHSRSCYTVQTTNSSHLPVHIDKDDSLAGISTIHSNVYSLIIPILGKASTTFYQLHDADLGPNNTEVDYRYGLYINTPEIENTLDVVSSVIILQPTILNISYPHSVKMITDSRVTYHVKLLQCKYDIDEIGKILSDS